MKESESQQIRNCQGGGVGSKEVDHDPSLHGGACVIRRMDAAEREQARWETEGGVCRSSPEASGGHGTPSSWEEGSGLEDLWPELVQKAWSRQCTKLCLCWDHRISFLCLHGGCGGGACTR